jgi:HEAT repeat protein
MRAVTTKRSVLFGALLTTAVFVAVKPDALVAAWHGFTTLIVIGGDPRSASPPSISEDEIARLSTMDPQDQAVLLLERTIDHYGGAAALIEARVDGWRGNLGMTHTLEETCNAAMKADDLRVRAAAIEIDLAAYGVEKTPEAADRIMKRIDAEPGAHPRDLWLLGSLGNRGVEPQRVLDYVVTFVDAPDLESRHWAVEALTVLGTDGAIAPLLHAFHDDPSGLVRERAARGLARSGMLTEAQRWTAIPELIRFTDDPKLDAQTQRWAFQALQEITGRRFDNDAEAWRTWWDRSPKHPETARASVAMVQSAH